MTVKYVLRDLPGVAEMEERLARIEAHPNPNWAPEADGLDEALEQLSRRLFGIVEDDTLYEWDEDLFGHQNEAKQAEWELRFDPAHDDDPAVLQAELAKLGWDIARPDGELCLSATHLARQIIAVAYGICGHAPGIQTELSQREVEDVEARLREEAAKFRPSRR